jgi:hypothetical protein
MKIMQKMESKKMKKIALSMTLIFVLVTLISLVFANSSQAKIDHKTMVGLWLLNEITDKTVADLSGNGNDGILQGSPKLVEGKFGKALRFNGSSDYVNCGNKEILSMTKAITIQFYFKTEKKMSVFEDRQAIVGKYYLEYEVGIYPAGVIHTYTSDGAAAYNEGINTAIAGKLPDGDADWTLDKWFHLAWTLKDTLEIVYVNGVKIGEFNKPNAGTKPGTHNLEIGRRTQDASLPFMGTIDEVAIFNVALLPADIQNCADNGMEKALGLMAVSNTGKLATTWANIKR